mmetsp:Transcript_7474/g.23753  ORF Transcript_7474/g.23753 Transcript_7474/m.23753 type:complete len:259 (-) Transcript_7474:88-864(-)
MASDQGHTSFAESSVRIVFLDVDGVLNTDQPDSPSLGLDPGSLRHFVDLVTRLERDFGGGAAAPLAARIVVSSDWRRKPELMRELDAGLHSALAAAGLRADVLDGGLLGERAPGCRLCSIPAGAPSKPLGISAWLAVWGRYAANWVAVDDLDLPGLAQLEAPGAKLFAGHFVRTDAARGMTEAEVSEALCLLGAPWGGREEQLLRAVQVAAACSAASDAPRQGPRPLRCDDCGQVFDTTGARGHMESTGGEHCMFSEV